MYGNYYHVPGRVTRQRISMQQAQEIALARVPGQIVHVDMELEHGVLVYEIFIMTSDNRLFEVEVLAKSGRILKVEEEDDED
ncbi:MULTISPECIES: PepSY domain-containing protein [Paenibacillus]|uniref:PepSY domain-containing protein n=1 Tax=Paenibacillus TaxID=44249 RepID=UPI0001789648|nr:MULTISPECIES: PepSY domain-containing protein [Paenibacillus]ACX63397.1 Propeptide PepSY amd peptidase M4 [Paenibacillus sp. Y412MC10]EGG34962.1 peptidase propeptide and YpeB domain protein [Paenibacillus sp. HGF5]ETT64452.1 propeptide PepSY amd peptidase M4 [Paenibacillus sp. FSL H8-457]MCM3260601.1 PepSY domain-containing protein [Paenibacillus lautus]